MSDPVYRNRPTLFGLIVRPRQQVRAALAFVVAAWAVNGALFLALSRDRENLAPPTLALYIFGSTLLLSVIALAAGVVLTHRIFGPIVSIKRQIAALREGQYSARLQLRETDDLTEVKDALNDLAAALEQRHGPGHRAPS